MIFLYENSGEGGKVDVVSVGALAFLHPSGGDPLSTTPNSNRTTHTPGPWKRQAAGSDLNPTVGIFAEHGPFVAQTVGGNDEANADFIVRACNSHEELVAALKAIIDAEHDFMAATGCEWDDDVAKAIVNAEAALAKAEGK